MWQDWTRTMKVFEHHNNRNWSYKDKLGQESHGSSWSLVQQRHRRHRWTTKHPLELHHRQALRRHYILDKIYRGRQHTRHTWTTNHPLELHHWRALRRYYILDKNYRGRQPQWHLKRWIASHLATEQLEQVHQANNKHPQSQQHLHLHTGLRQKRSISKHTTGTYKQVNNSITSATHIWTNRSLQDTRRTHVDSSPHTTTRWILHTTTDTTWTRPWTQSLVHESTRWVQNDKVWWSMDITVAKTDRQDMALRKRQGREEDRNRQHTRRSTARTSRTHNKQ